MIIRFAVDSTAFADDKSDLAAERAVHLRLIELWEKYGILVSDSDPISASNLAKKLEQSDQSIRKLWIEAMKKNRRRSARGGIPALETAETADALLSWQHEIDVALLEKTRAVLAGLPPDDDCYQCASAGIEICRFDLADRSKRFAEAIALSVAPIAKGTLVSTVWRDRFLPAAGVCKKQITVVDRYCAANHAASKLRGSAYSGLRKIVTEVNAMSLGVGMTLYSSPADRSEADVVAAVTDLIANTNRNGIREFTLHLCDEAKFGRSIHGRYVRFDNVVLDIDTGLEVLEGKHVIRDSSFRMSNRTSAHDACETGLVGISVTHRIRVQ